MSDCEIQRIAEAGTLGVTEHTDVKQLVFSVYPNPTNGNFQIDLKDSYDTVRVQIFNVTGKLVKEKQFSQTKIVKLQFTAAKGLYIVKVSLDGTNSFVSKIIKR